jgi:hypothetical protein
MRVGGMRLTLETVLAAFAGGALNGSNDANVDGRLIARKTGFPDRLQARDDPISAVVEWHSGTIGNV